MHVVFLFVEKRYYWIYKYITNHLLLIVFLFWNMRYYLFYKYVCHWSFSGQYYMLFFLVLLLWNFVSAWIPYVYSLWSQSPSWSIAAAMYSLNLLFYQKYLSNTHSWSVVKMVTMKDKCVWSMCRSLCVWYIEFTVIIISPQITWPGISNHPFKWHNQSLE